MEISGILTKQGQKMKTWRRRYFELYSNRLCYYLYDGGPMKGEFLLDENTTIQISNLKRHGFSVVQRNGKTLNMYADNAIDKDRWMNSLLKIITRLKSTQIETSKPGGYEFKEVKEENVVKEAIKETDRQNQDVVTISVHIIQGKDLAPKGSTDTYAKIQVDANHATTKVVKKELNPVWDEHFTFNWTSNLRFVRIEVWNDDPMHSSRDNFLGVIYIPILSLSLHSVTPLWYKLGKRSSRSNVSGEIKVSVSCNRDPDAYVLKFLRDIQKIPELQTHAADLRHFGNHGDANSLPILPDSQLDSEKVVAGGYNHFPGLIFPPLETEFSEDLSLRVTFRPTLDKSTSASVEGILLLTNYRVIFVSHARIAFAEECTTCSNDNNNINNNSNNSTNNKNNRTGMNEELTCSIPLTMIVSLNIHAFFDAHSCQYEDALTLTTNDSRVFAFIFHGSRSQIANEPTMQEVEPINDVVGRRAISLDTSNAKFSTGLDRSESSKFLSFDRSFSSNSLTKGFLSQFWQSNRNNGLSGGDELGYLEGKSSVEGPPSQRIYARILWKIINRSVEINCYKKIHSNLIRSINFQEDDILIRPADSLTLSTGGGDDETIVVPRVGDELNVKLPDTEEMNKLATNPFSNHYGSLLSLPPQIKLMISSCLKFGWNIYDPIAEFERMGIPDAMWRISKINQNYTICSTYPALLVVPETIDDSQLAQASLFRSRGRLPALSWRHPHNFCSLTRCSQPLVGLGQNRSHYDELLLEAINQAGTSPMGDDVINLTTTKYTSLLSKSRGNVTPTATNQLGEMKKPLVIVDARPKINAQANQAAGKGYEMGKGYENCRILFMNIANIHAMRKSIDALEELCCKWTTDDSNWQKNVDSTGWLGHVSRVLSASARIVHCMAIEEFSVLVHCSDGWDRTAQLTSLPMLMMDPFYRTYDGFMILIEKEWFSFGHKFAERLGWGEDGWHDDERSPVFHQFLDCVFQCINQNPNIFEFNEKLLIFIATQVLTGWFGNIFSNCESERKSSGVMNTTFSIWTYIHSNRSEFCNPYYSLYPHIWVPNSQSRRIIVWKQWFLRWHNQIWELSWKKKNEDFTELSDVPPRWMEDSSVKECCGCHRLFNFVRRRHHCRACGKIYCETCVGQTRIVLSISETIPVRCCNDCVAIMDIQESHLKSPRMLTSKRSGHLSGFSIDSSDQNAGSAHLSKRSSMRFQYSRPSCSFDQYHPKLKKQDTSLTQECDEEYLEDKNDFEGGGGGVSGGNKGKFDDVGDDNDDDLSDGYSTTSSPSSKSSPHSTSLRSSPRTTPRTSPIPRSKTAFTFDSHDINPYFNRDESVEVSAVDDTHEKTYSMKLASSPLSHPPSDRPRSTSYIVTNNNNRTLALRTSRRYDNIKPNNNPLALTTLGNKYRLKKVEK